MRKNGFDNLKNDSWLFTSVVYSYISFAISFFNLFEAPGFSLGLQVLTIAILIYSRFKGRKKYVIPTYISLVLNVLLAILAWIVL